MEKVVAVASYICQRYQEEYGTRIDEMKLHKLLYFVQRESIIQTDAPIFNEQFEAWRYGPVMFQIRHLYKEDDLNIELSPDSISKYQDVFDYVFVTYASKDSWSLSSITHGEYCWEKARTGVNMYENSTKQIDTQDIRVDAERIKIRRFLSRKLHQVG